nr:MAG: hypothetical protein ADFBMEEK_00047 [Peromyscus leucopus gammaherpesvirus]
MGIVCSICKRGNNTINDIDGQPIDVSAEFEELEFSEDSMLLSKNPPPPEQNKEPKKPQKKPQKKPGPGFY